MYLAIADTSGNALFFQVLHSFVQLMRVAVPTAWDTRQTPEQRSEIRNRHKALLKRSQTAIPDPPAIAWPRTSMSRLVPSGLLSATVDGP